MRFGRLPGKFLRVPARAAAWGRRLYPFAGAPQAWESDDQFSLIRSIVARRIRPEHTVRSTYATKSARFLEPG